MTWTRRRALGTALTAAAGGALARCMPRVRRPPNLLFIHTDQLRAGVLSGQGNPHIATPSLDRLEGEGTSFALSYAASPVCVPARATWYTGRLPSEHGALDNAGRFQREFPDLGGWLDDAGYRCVYVGKWHVPRPPEACFRHLHHGRGSGAVGDPAIAEAAEAFLLNYPGTAPFFLNVGFLQPHDICFWYEERPGPRAEPSDLIVGRLPPLPENADAVPAEPARLHHLRRWESEIVNGWTDLAWRHALWSYHRQVEMVDREVGRVLAALDDSGHREDTVVLFSSDHGEMAGGHRLILKDVFYEEASRVPLVVRWPGHVDPGRRDTTHVVHGADVFPTFCDFAGVPLPSELPGRSLRRLAEGRRTEWPEHRVTESGREGRMVRTAREKYVRYAGDPVEQLFDLVDDPGESKNLALQTSARGRLEDHRRRLAEAFASGPEGAGRSASG